MSIKVALPKGRLLNDTASLTSRAGWGLSDYSESARLYHLKSSRFPDLTAKILHEKDIPIQVAIGNYDLGICGLEWIQELIVKYPASGLVKVRNLGYACRCLFLAADRRSGFPSLDSVRNSNRVISIATEYPNLAESVSLNCRFKRFNIFPVWGAAEIFPPESADLVLLPANSQSDLPVNLASIANIMDSAAFLIANKTSWENQNLNTLLNTLTPLIAARTETTTVVEQFEPVASIISTPAMPPESIRLALPDGHQQKHMVNILNKARIKISDYPSYNGNRRPEIALPGFSAKVIRPQDMPLQVANGKFDIAITGKDWVREHLYKFPSSPIVELADLKYGRVNIVAAVHKDLEADDISSLRKLVAQKAWKLRVASEYVSIADRFARDNRLGMYRIIPTWGATEAFLPDDADILIENTETGSTLKRHNLKVIETLFESTACLIGNAGTLNSAKAARIEDFAETLKRAVQEN